MAEIVTAVVVLAFLFSVAVPAISMWSGTVHFREITLGVATDLRLARSSAVEGGTETMVELDVAGASYRLARGDLPTGSTAWTELKPWAPLGVGVGLATGKGCDGAGKSSIVFAPDGTSPGGVVCIKDPSGAERFRVVVSSPGGRVSLE